MLSRHPPLSIRNLQKFGKIIDGHLVLSGNGVATAAADQAFLIEAIHGQRAGIVNDGGIQTALNFVNLAQVEIGIVTVRVKIGRIEFDNMFQGLDGTQAVRLVKTFPALFEPFRDCLR
jgi:hypothetical protein